MIDPVARVEPFVLTIPRETPYLGALRPGQVVSQDLPPNLITANAPVSAGDQPDRRALLAGAVVAKQDGGVVAVGGGAGGPFAHPHEGDVGDVRPGGQRSQLSLG
mgnify:CR=1 FL=1